MFESAIDPGHQRFSGSPRDNGARDRSRSRHRAPDDGEHHHESARRRGTMAAIADRL
jgi:hypothetical protein